MRIDEVEVVLAAAGAGLSGGTNCFVVIRTDSGITGVGQSGTWGYPEAVASVLTAFRPYLVGADPKRIEHHWQQLYRVAPFRGNILHGAISAVDIALWDIKAKHLEVPVSELLGGRSRDHVRLMLLVLDEGHPPEHVDAFIRDAVAAGFTAVKFDPLPRVCGDVPMARLVSIVRDNAAAAREAAGPDVDLVLEFGRKLTPLQAPTLLDAVAEFHPLFVEDPLQIDSIRSQAEIARGASVPIAHGERLTSIWEFRELIEDGAVQYVRPDLGMAGGFTHCKKIAAVAESFNATVVPHNWLGPLLTAASIHLDATIPNFVVQEYDVREESAPEYEMFRTSLRREGGTMRIPEEPGLGLDLLPAVAAKHPAVRLDFGALSEFRRHRDGSVGTAL
jgi:galactonate dehydratase